MRGHCYFHFKLPLTLSLHTGIRKIMWRMSKVKVHMVIPLTNKLLPMSFFARHSGSVGIVVGTVTISNGKVANVVFRAGRGCR